jgi:hypothetical protein
MSMINPFDVFSVTEMADAVNLIPNTYGRLGQDNLMPVRGALTNPIAIEERNGVLSMIPFTEINGPGVVGSGGLRKVRTFNIPRLVYEEGVSPREVANVRMFASSVKRGLADLLSEKLADARAKHDITLEHLRMGALKGIILDADGSTVLYNLYTEFGITQKTVDFDLGDDTADVPAACRAVVRHIEDNLHGEVMSSIRAEVSAEFYDALVAHASVKAIYAGWSANEQRRGGDMRDGFPLGGIVFREYRGTATGSAGSAVRFIASGEGHAYPLGTQSTFRTYSGLPDFNEAVAASAQLYYAKVEPRKFGRGYDVHTQSNPLPMCLRPGVLVKLYSST